MQAENHTIEKYLPHTNYFPKLLHPIHFHISIAHHHLLYREEVSCCLLGRYIGCRNSWLRNDDVSASTISKEHSSHSKNGDRNGHFVAEWENESKSGAWQKFSGEISLSRCTYASTSNVHMLARNIAYKLIWLIIMSLFIDILRVIGDKMDLISALISSWLGESGGTHITEIACSHHPAELLAGI